MAGYFASHEQRPITFWGRVPVYAIGILTAGYAAGLVVSVLCESARISLLPLTFRPLAFFHGALWQPLTFSFLGQPSFFTLLALMCMYSWGVEVERHLGRSRFLTLFASIVLVQPLVAIAWWRVVGASVGIAGSYELTAALLIAFATIYPGIEYFGWIPLKWFAFACLVIGSLMYFPEHDWVRLSLLWATCATSFGYIRALQQGRSLDVAGHIRKLFRPRPRLSVVPRDAAAPGVRRGKTRDAVDSIDAILEKISRTGMASLTARERATLEKARETLIKKEPENS
jgi:hypothetical protein